MEAEEASENTMSDIVEVIYIMDLKQMTLFSSIHVMLKLRQKVTKERMQQSMIKKVDTLSVQ